MDVVAWLRGLGLEQYEPAFRANEIDWTVLPKLTSEDLREIGVVPIGHRRRMLDAIAVLSNERTIAVATARRQQVDAERRQLTVMFCDLVGSTELSARFDPEDLREVIAVYHHAVAEVVRTFDGFVAKYMGDGVLVYFGYPQAHEDDAERAVRAGLGVIDGVGRLDVKSVELRARVGIATGLVVVGDLIGEGSAQEQSVVGETPNLAARLQALAEPRAVVIAASTRRLIGDLFEYRDLGTVDLKGITVVTQNEPCRIVALEPGGDVHTRLPSAITSASVYLTQIAARALGISVAGRRPRSRCAWYHESRGILSNARKLRRDHIRPDPDPVLAHPCDVALGSPPGEVTRAANGSFRRVSPIPPAKVS